MPIPVPVPSPSEIRDFARSIAQHWRLWRQNRLLEAAAKGRCDTRLSLVLNDLYPAALPLPDVANVPVSIVRVPQQQRHNPDAILGRLSPEELKMDLGFYTSGEEYLQLLQDQRLPLEDLQTFCLDRLRFDEGVLRLDAVVGRYFDALRSCDSLQWELLTTLGKSSGRRTPKGVVQALVHRARAHACAGDPLAFGRGRSAAIGISVAVVFRTESDYKILVAPRSARGVAVNQGLLHVAPSGMFQPAAGGDEREFSVLHNVFREYLEELFRIGEAQRTPSVIAYDYFYNNPNLLFLRELLEGKQAQITVTGIAMDLLNLRPEICLILQIDSPVWFQRHKTGERGLSVVQLNDEFGPGICALSLSRARELLSKFVPSGAAAVSLALEEFETA